MARIKEQGVGEEETSPTPLPVGKALIAPSLSHWEREGERGRVRSNPYPPTPVFAYQLWNPCPSPGNQIRSTIIVATTPTA
jgi:hypothetical protein